MQVNFRVNEYPRYASAIRDAELRHRIPSDLLALLLWQSSRYIKETIEGTKQHSRHGAVGIAMLTPDEAADMNIPIDSRTNPALVIERCALRLATLHRECGTWQRAALAHKFGKSLMLSISSGARAMPDHAAESFSQINSLLSFREQIAA